MHVAQVGFYFDPKDREPRALLHDWPSIVDVAEAAAGTGARVSVVQACTREQTLALNGVNYYFVAPPADIKPRLRARACARKIVQRIAILRPDVVHVHGMNFSGPVAMLAQQVPSVPILLQDHADRPLPFWRRLLGQRGTPRAAGVALCSREQLTPFTKAGMLPESVPVFEIPESTSRFQPGDREHARRLTGVQGNPAVLWVGHLDANKDPLTVLAALKRTADSLPGLELWCVYGSTTLLAPIERLLRGDPALQRRVHLLGSVPHSQVETLMNAADLFVSASHREGSGYALIEALACGLPPVVTDIPSFRALTGNGEVGLLWPPGDSAALAENLLRGAALAQQSRAPVRAHFVRELSSQAVGCKLAEAYRQLHARSITKGN